MSEPYGRTDMLYCGCTVTPDGYIATECASHRNFELPEPGTTTETEKQR